MTNSIVATEWAADVSNKKHISKGINKGCSANINYSVLFDYRFKEEGTHDEDKKANAYALVYI